MPGNPLSDPTWAPRLADTVERLVAAVRDKTTRPVLIAYRGLVFGLVAAFGALFALSLVVIVAVRGVQAVIEIVTNHADAVWISYLLIGALCSIAGVLVMRRRFPRATTS